MEITGSDLNLGEDNQWGVNLTMSDITRAVNAFITNPASSSLGCVVPKQEIDEDTLEGLYHRSNSNPTINITDALESESIPTHKISSLDPGQYITGAIKIERGTADHKIFENRIVREDAMFPKTDVSILDVSKIQENEDVRNIADSRNEIFSNNIAKPKYVNTDPCVRPLTGGVMLINNSKVKSNAADRGMEVISGGLQLESDLSGGVKATSTPKRLRRPEYRKEIVYKNIHVCPIKECGVQVTSKNKLNIHVRTNHKSEGFRREKCGKRCGTIGTFEEHQDFHKGIKPYQCEVCGENFVSSSKAYTHFQTRHLYPENKAQCEICGVVGSRSSLSTHIRVVHLKERFKCSECVPERLFRTLESFKDHMRMHRGEERYKCELCPQSFEQRKSMLRHFRRHSRTLQCPKCDKVFKTKSFLKGHLLQHEGIKKHCCNVCGKTFVHAHYLSTHLKSHGEKLFECEICGGKFNRKDNLKSHIIRHQTTGRKNLKQRKGKI